MSLAEVVMLDGKIYNINFRNRFYMASGTGTVEIYGAQAGSSVFEKLVTITVSASSSGVASADEYPRIKGVVTSGAPVFSVSGTERAF